MTVVAVVMIVGCCAYIGNSIANQYRKKQFICSDLLLFINAYKNNLSYTQQYLRDFFISQQQYLHMEMKEILNQYIKCVDDNRDIIICCNLLDNEQNMLITQFFSGIGGSDRESQLQFLMTFEQMFNLQLETATAKYNKSGLLAKKMLVLGGIVVSILLL